MSPIKLHSPLTREIQNFINLRRLSGTDYKSQAQLLGYFDRFLLTQRLRQPRITREIIDRYLMSLSSLAPRSRHNRFSVVRQLCEYLARNDSSAYGPEPLRTIPSLGAHPPYIFSHAELQALLTAASTLPPPDALRRHTYRTLLGLLYSTGIRIGEGDRFDRGGLPPPGAKPLYRRRQVPQVSMGAPERFYLPSAATHLRQRCRWPPTHPTPPFP